MQSKIIIGVLGFVLLSGIVFSIYTKGYNACKLDMKVEQIKHEKKVKKQYDKIDKTTPFNKSVHDKLEWLFQYGRDESISRP